MCPERRERKSVIARDECRRRKVDEQTNKEGRGENLDPFGLYYVLMVMTMSTTLR